VFGGCTIGGQFSVDCTCLNNQDSIIKTSDLKCQSPGCNATTVLKFDTDLSYSNVSLKVQLSDFNSTEKYITGSTPFNLKNYTGNLTENNCGAFATLENSKLSDFQSTFGEISLNLKTSPSVQEKCSGNVLNAELSLSTLPCFAAPNIWFKADDFSEYVRSIASTRFGVSLHPGIRGKAFRFKSKYSNVQFFPGNFIGGNNGITVAVWARPGNSSSKQTVFSYQAYRSSVADFSFTFVPQLAVYYKGQNITSPVSVDFNTYRHYAVSITSDGSVKFFKDGIVVHVASFEKIVTLPVNGFGVFGQFYTIESKQSIFRDNYHFDGDLDDIQIFMNPVNDDIIKIISQQRDATSSWSCNINTDDDLGLNHGLTSNVGIGEPCRFNKLLSDFILINPVSRTNFPISEFSISFNFAVSAGNGGSMISYATTKATILNILIVNNKFVILMGGTKIETGVENYSNSVFSFFALTWKSYTGELKIYGKDHAEIYSNNTISKFMTIPQSGTWVFGQRQLHNVLHFDNSQMFEGQLRDIQLSNKIQQYGKCNNVPESSPDVCSGKGHCVGSECQCNSGTSGANCQSYRQCFGFSSNSTSVCSSRGSCIFDNVCACMPGYSGAQCESRMELFDFIDSACKQDCNLDMSFWFKCLLIEGPSCYCGYNKNNISIECNVNEIVGL
jgi:hypothetical protein